MAFVFANVILPLPLKPVFTYSVPKEFEHSLARGMRVLVPFGRNKILTGLVFFLTDEKPDKKFSIKDILDVLDDSPAMNDFQFQLFQWMAEYYMCSLGEVYRAAMPSAFKLHSRQLVKIHPDFVLDETSLTDAQHRIVEALVDHKTLPLKRIGKMAGVKSVHSVVRDLEKMGVIVQEKEILKKYKQKTETIIKVHSRLDSDEKIKSALAELEKYPKRQDLFMVVLQLKMKGEEKSRAELLEKAKATPGVLNALIEKEYLIAEKIPVDRLIYDLEKVKRMDLPLKEEQQNALSAIEKEFSRENPRPILLHGVTGSGKTQIYIERIKKIIAQGKQVLYLLPEIALTKQIIQRIASHFEGIVGVYHSKLSDNERAEMWNHVRDKKYQIIVGVRSAVFLPFTHLGLIVIDEEHENSYKQFDPAPRYHARDTALYLAKIFNAKVILGSATPSLESYYNAQKEKYLLLEMKKRVFDGNLPDIELVDMKEERKQKKSCASYSEILLSAMEKNLNDEQQVIIFQNRRGYIPYTECTVCAFTPRCINCDVSLIYHKRMNHLRCHHCGYTQPVEKNCPSCGSQKWLELGLGTEKIEDELKTFFPKAHISRMDLDTTRGKNNYIRIISDFEKRKIDILVGTQMISKGLDFDNVGLVGIVDADKMLKFPDFRSQERSFQMFTQVSGRAGRGNKKGKVLIQTTDTKQPTLEFVMRADYKGFYEYEIPLRSQLLYPPFSRMIRIETRHRDRKMLEEQSLAFGKSLKRVFSKNFLGPEFPLVEKEKNIFRMQMLLKVDAQKSFSRAKEMLAHQIESFESRHKQLHKVVDPHGESFGHRTEIVLDVDPY